MSELVTILPYEGIIFIIAVYVMRYFHL